MKTNEVITSRKKNCKMKRLLVLTAILFLLIVNLFAQDIFRAKVYFDYKYDINSSPTNEFEIKRAYLTYRNKFSDNLFYKFTSDVDRYGEDDRLSLYVKNALVKWKTGFGELVFGMQGMNVFKIQEYNWGYRFIEKSAMNLHNFSSSADLGFGYYNTFTTKLHVSALITNGSGYKNSENDDYKKLSFQVFYGDSEIKKDGNFNVGGILSLESFDYESTTDTTTKKKTVVGGFVVYRLSGFKIGAEYDMFKTGGIDVTKNIISAYANYAIGKEFDLFTRIDIYDPNTTNDNDSNTYIIVGFNYNPTKILYIAPNIKYSKSQTGDTLTIYQINLQFKV